MVCQFYFFGKGINLGEGVGFVVFVKDQFLVKYGKIIGGFIILDGYYIIVFKLIGEGVVQIVKQLVI